ncbi:hypothetical protein D3C73_1225660 [compost metagenome]
MSVLFAEAAGTDPVVHLLAPGQIRLHVATVERVALPGLLVETLVSRRGLERRAVEQDIFQLKAECSHMPSAMHGLLQHLSQDHAGSAEQVAPARTDHRVQAQRMHRGLLGEIFILLVHCATPARHPRRAPDSYRAAGQPGVPLKGRADRADLWSSL